MQRNEDESPQEYVLNVMKQQLAAKRWQTLDGQLLHIEKMDTSHIRRALNMLMRSQHELANDWIKTFKSELERRENDLS